MLENRFNVEVSMGKVLIMGWVSALQVARAELGDCDRIGSEARFFDDNEKRPGILEYEKWNATRTGDKLK